MMPTLSSPLPLEALVTVGLPDFFSSKVLSLLYTYKENFSVQHHFQDRIVIKIQAFACEATNH